MLHVVTHQNLTRILCSLNLFQNGRNNDDCIFILIILLQYCAFKIDILDNNIFLLDSFCYYRHIENRLQKAGV